MNFRAEAWLPRPCGASAATDGRAGGAGRSGPRGWGCVAGTATQLPGTSTPGRACAEKVRHRGRDLPQLWAPHSSLTEEASQPPVPLSRRGFGPCSWGAGWAPAARLRKLPGAWAVMRPAWPGRDKATLVFPSLLPHRDNLHSPQLLEGGCVRIPLSVDRALCSPQDRRLHPKKSGPPNGDASGAPDQGDQGGEHLAGYPQYTLDFERQPWGGVCNGGQRARPGNP